MEKHLTTKGRIIRGAIAFVVLGIAAYGYFEDWSPWLWIPIVALGLFVAFEAIKGWCVARACGIKTKY
jgi:hypothetical protein